MPWWQTRPRARVYGPNVPKGYPHARITCRIAIGRSRGQLIEWCTVCQHYIVAGHCQCPPNIVEAIKRHEAEKRLREIGITIPTLSPQTKEPECNNGGGL